MKKIRLIVIILSFLVLLIIPGKAYALNEKVNVYMFYGQSCPHCEEEYEYLNGIKEKYNINI